VERPAGRADSLGASSHHRPAGKSFSDHGGSAGSAFNPTNYGYFWWVEPTSGVTAYYALGFGGQLIEVVPSLHLLIVVSSNVDETRPGAPVVGPDEVQHLVDAIVPIIKTHRNAEPVRVNGSEDARPD